MKTHFLLKKVDFSLTFINFCREALCLLSFIFKKLFGKEQKTERHLPLRFFKYVV